MTKARLAIELYCGRCGELYIDVTKCPHHGTSAHDLDLEEAIRIRARYAFAKQFDPEHDEEESSYRDEWDYCSDMWGW
jgi:hypothetical protein